MKSRINSYQAAPGVMKAMMALQNEVAQSGLDPSLVGLVEIRASQINGCAFCLHMHTRDARARGETEQRIYLLDAWRESPLYSERERAALAWTEAVTLVSRDPRARRGLRAGESGLLRGGAGEAHLAGGDHQRLEPVLDRLPRDPSGDRESSRLAKRLR